jgi:hypothetical protein
MKRNKIKKINKILHCLHLVKKIDFVYYKIIIMSIHYTTELTKLGFKYNLPRSIIEEIYNYNKTTYLTHYNVVLHYNDNILIMSMNYCTKNKIYYEKSACQHCNQCKYCIHKNHKYCDTCEKCIDDNHTNCKICKTFHYYPHHQYNFFM